MVHEGALVSTVLLAGGDVGYTSTRDDDCLRPCIATVLQVPIEEVPDPRIDERQAAGDRDDVIVRESWEALWQWLHDRGLEMVLHDEPATDLERWIAVTRVPSIHGFASQVGAATFAAHCLVMRYRRMILDPALSIPPPPGHRLLTWLLTDTAYSISFTQREE